ncbi:VirB4 family type IV secretion/conjugal transfer ATPase [Phenylobacterium sp.]|uniref:VirB4 family type IV secretion/conjugal transfer ATPase n=1 Tax=Phenylobacterium sp. TaxID=1871053 RepID=UPI0012055759|nr:VirB4 family type IV secretion/conjugal transfer ATPase [Phenylobacterium sp.]THD63895.1 MAG: VirB4 family type IV secretion/conjugal transfer ATPase [Phenylobacterium sp.]
MTPRTDDRPKARRAAPGREASAGARLPYARHVDDVTIATRDGMLMQVIHLAGLPFETADTDELNYRKALRDGALRALASSRFAIYHHVVRREVAPAMDGDFNDDFSRTLDDTWRARLGAKKLYVNELFLTLVRRPLQGRGGMVEGALRAITGGRQAQSAVAFQNEHRELDAARESLLAALAPYGARLLGVYDTPSGPCSEPLEFLSSLYNGAIRPVLLPRADLGEHIPYRRVSFGAEALELSRAGVLDRSFAALISIKDYPPQTAAGMLDDLLRLPHELVISQSFAFVDRQASLERMNMALRRMRSADDDALSLRLGLVAAKDDVSAGRAAFGEHHLSVMVRAASLAGLNEAVAEVQSSFTEVGVIAVREDVNLEPAFWAQFPGNFKDIARRALISTANFAGFASGHNFPVGKAAGNHWGSAVTVLETTSAGPYHFNFHKGDLGNFTLIGPSGSGKTVVLSFLLAQARKFDPRIVFFDKDRGAEIFLRAIGGRYDAIRPGEATGFNPLQLEDTPANRGFLADWTARLVARPGEALSPEDLARIKDAVDANYAQQPAYRRLRYFAELFRGDRRPDAADLAARLRPWWGDGERAWLFDNADDALDLDARTLGFDMTQILDDPQLRTPAMMYLFHRVEQRLDGDPTLIVIDEGWKALDDDVFVARIKDWEKTIRKRNGVVGFATQSAQDAIESRIASAIIEQAATQIFMANPKAQARDYCEGFGLTEHEFDLIRSLPDTSHCFLIKHGTDSVVARLNLSGEPDLLTVLSGRERTVRLLDTLRGDVGENPADWLPRLLERA